MMAMRAKLTATALACALLSACGIKGSLYLPPTPSGQPAPGADHSKPAQPPAPGQYTPIQ
ncbi:LPS translocon maturation chaperone LptM [Thauera linaloolentis]|uniref:LPS translocon maturation chaperone LptM n=1 Tax=Thauera linaloolentis TaxID=76112 RepID=UPI0009DB2331